MYTKFVLNKSIRSQDIEKKRLNYAGMTDKQNDGRGKSSIAPTFSKWTIKIMGLLVL